jgi:hypothetical protein
VRAQVQRTGYGVASVRSAQFLSKLEELEQSGVCGLGVDTVRCSHLLANFGRPPIRRRRYRILREKPSAGECSQCVHAKH